MNHLAMHKTQHSKEYFYHIRKMYSISDPIELASRFIYLNKTCFNGLFRVNKKEQFNVPYGKYKNPQIFDPNNLRLASTHLKNVDIRYSDFSEICPKKDDFVYFDPPYHSTSLSSFVGYTKNRFNEKDHIKLSEFAKKLHNKGVKVMISNADTPFVRELFNAPYFTVEEISAPRFINAKAKQRKNAPELLIRNYP